MALNAGDRAATSGMAREIYRMIDATLRPPVEEDLSEEAVKEMQEKWRELSFAIAEGVVRHLRRAPPSEADHAEVFSSKEHDEAYWDWLAGFAGLFREWATDGGDLTSLRTRINQHEQAHPVPESLRGVLR